MSSGSIEKEERFNEVLAGYLEAVEAGTLPDRQEMLARHPDLASELQEFFTNHDRVGRLAVPSQAETLAPGNSAQSDPGPRTLRYFGDYELLEELARGGMGVVYRARQVSLNRVVALKMILAGQFATDADVRRFKLEAEAAANLDHPHIVPLYEIGEHQGQQYFSMKLIADGSLKEHLAEFTADHRAAARLISTIARAVHYAHQRGLLHRDLKPANILLSFSRDAESSERSAMRLHEGALRSEDSASRLNEFTPMIADFGLAKRVERDSGLTESGAIVGTPSYMAPEQAAGRKGLSTAADTYSLGAILYEMLTGRPPFQAETPLDTLLQVLERDPQRPRLLNARINRDLETICLKCLGKEPALRYGSAAALAEDLEHWLAGEPITARPASESERLWRWCRRNPVVAGLTGTVAALLVAISIGAILAAVRLQREGEATFWALLRAEGMRLTAQSELVRPTNPGLALLLAIEGADHPPGLLANNALLAAVEANSECRTFVGHTNSLFSAAISADGQRVLTWSVDRTARVWDSATGKEVARLQHDAAVVFGCFSPDGRRVLTIASRNFTLDHRGFISGGVAGETAARTWDAATGKMLASWKDPGNENETWARRHRESSYAGSFSPDGRWVVTTFGVYPESPPQIHETDTGKQIAVLDGHEGPVIDLAFHPDGKQIVTASLDGTARLWEAATGKPLRTWKSPDGGVIAVVFSPDGKRVLTVGDGYQNSFKVKPDGRVDPIRNSINRKQASDVAARIWDTSSGEERLVLHWPGVRAFGTRKAVFSADGTGVVRGSCVWDAGTGKLRATLSGGHERLTAVHAACFSPDGRWVVTAGDDRTVRLWDAKTGKEAATLRGHEGPIYAAIFSSDGRYVLTASADWTARLWETSAAEPPGPAQGSWPTLRCVALSPDGRRLVANLESDHLRGDFIARVWDTDTGKELPPLRGHKGTVEVIAFSPDGRKVVTGSDDHTARVWDSATGKQLAVLRGHTGRITSVMFSPPDGQHVLTASDDQSGRIWNAETGAEELVLKGSEENAQELLKKGGDMLHLAKAVVIYYAWFSPDGKRVLTTSLGPQFGLQNDVAARVWHAKTGKELAVLKSTAEVGDGRWAVFSPDSRSVLLAGANAACLWFPDTGKQHFLKGHDGGVTAAAFSPDGQRLVTASRDRTARIWHVATGAELAVLKHQETVTFAAWSPDGRWIITFDNNKTARIWGGAPTSREIRTIRYRNGQGIKYSVLPSRASTFKEILTVRWPEHEFRWAAFSKDGERVLIQTWNGARLWPTDVLKLANERKPRELTELERELFEIEIR